MEYIAQADNVNSKDKQIVKARDRQLKIARQTRMGRRTEIGARKIGGGVAQPLKR